MTQPLSQPPRYFVIVCEPTASDGKRFLRYDESIGEETVRSHPENERDWLVNDSIVLGSVISLDAELEPERKDGEDYRE